MSQNATKGQTPVNQAAEKAQYKDRKYLTAVFFVIALVLVPQVLRKLVEIAPQYIVLLDPNYAQRLEVWGFQERMEALTTMVFGVGVLIFGLTFLTMLCRIFGGNPNPVRFQDSLVITILNRSLQNMVEQGLAFAISLAYFTIVVSDKTTGKYTYLIGFAFFAARVFFTAGYFLGTLTGILSFRSFGFMLTTLCQIAVIAHCLGFKVFGVYI